MSIPVNDKQGLVPHPHSCTTKRRAGQGRQSTRVVALRVGCMQVGYMPESEHGVLVLRVGYVQEGERDILELLVELKSWKLLDEHVQASGRGLWRCWIDICDQVDMKYSIRRMNTIWQVKF